MNQKCLSVGIAGVPNSGKSTLMNALVGYKISIATPKVQTTRNTICGIVTQDETQIIFIDTPGIFKPQKPLEKAIVANAWQGLMDAEIFCLMIDASKKIGEETLFIINVLKEKYPHIKKVAILNKVDLITPKTRLFEIAQSVGDMGVFDQIFMISALKEKGLKELKKYLLTQAPQKEWIYESDDLTNAPSRFVAEEITREQLFLQLNQEIPYSLEVKTDSWKEQEDGSVKIYQTIHVLKQNQKAIILGKGGEKIKRVSQKARKEIEKFLEQPVHLFLFVKVDESWADRVNLNFLDV